MDEEAKLKIVYRYEILNIPQIIINKIKYNNKYLWNDRIVLRWDIILINCGSTYGLSTSDKFQTFISKKSFLVHGLFEIGTSHCLLQLNLGNSF